MGVINFGSMNVDHVYSMPHFVQPGETLQSGAYHIYCGGKGLNQSVAAARAGAKTMHAGMEARVAICCWTFCVAITWISP